MNPDWTDKELEDEKDYKKAKGLYDNFRISEKQLMKESKALDSLKERSFRLVPINTNHYETRDVVSQTEENYTAHQGKFIVLNHKGVVIVIEENHRDAIEKGKKISVGLPDLYYIRQK
jgi:hypothetical protein